LFGYFYYAIGGEEKEILEIQWMKKKCSVSKMFHDGFVIDNGSK